MAVSRRVFLSGAASIAAAPLLPAVPVDGMTVGVDMASGPDTMMWAIGTPGEYDWRPIAARSAKEAYQEFCRMRGVDPGLAQGTGDASKGGRPKKKTVGNENGFTSAEAGLTRDEISEGRKLLAAEGREPGLVERAIAARIEAGLEPSRRAVKHAIGTRTATREERGNNLYETPPEGMAVLLGLEEFLPLVLEPSCGRGAISRVLEAAGHEVMLTDLVDYGTADRHGQVQQVRDFLTLTRDEVMGWSGGEDFDIVGNPPYGEIVNAFIAHALTEIRPRKMALLLNLNFLCGYEDGDRNLVLDKMSPERAIVHAQRLPMMHRDGYDGQKASSQMNTMWLVWERKDWGGYEGDFRVVRAVWSDFDPVDAGGGSNRSGGSIGGGEGLRATPLEGNGDTDGGAKP